MKSEENTDEDDLKGMDFLNDIDNAETVEIPVKEVKHSKRKNQRNL